MANLEPRAYPAATDGVTAVGRARCGAPGEESAARFGRHAGFSGERRSGSLG